MTDKNKYPSVMKAVFLEKPGGELVVRETGVPEPGPGEVLVKISAAPVNPSDLARILNAEAGSNLPVFIPGLEGSGRVVAAGKGILPHLWLGKRVACASDYHTSGTWAEYMVTKAGNCFPLSGRVSDEQGAMTLVNPLTALAFIETVKRGKHRAFINNAASSALGRIVEMLAKKNHIHVINIVRNREQAAKLMQQGSEHVLNSTDSSFLESLGSLSRDLGATVLFDSVCSRQLEEMCDVLPYGSKIVIYGNISREKQVMFNPQTLIINNIKISAFYLGNQANENGLFKNTLNLMRVSSLMKKDLKIKVRECFPLTEVQKAVDIYLENMSAGKVLLIPDMT
jgi:NADPH2:quinone reductase